MMDFTDKALRSRMRANISQQELPREILERALAATRQTLSEEKKVSSVMRALDMLNHSVHNTLQRTGMMKDDSNTQLSNIDNPGNLRPFTPYARVHLESADARVMRDQRVVNVGQGKQIALREGDRMQSGNGSVKMWLFSGQQSTLTAGSDFRMARFASLAGNKVVNIVMTLGRAHTRITQPLKAGDCFNIGSNTAYADVRGTEFVTEVLAADETFFATISGKIAVHMDENEVEVPAGYQLRAVVGQPMQPVKFAQAPAHQKPKRKLPQDVRIYIAMEGDTVFSVARRFAVSIDVLMHFNPALRSQFNLVTGEAVVVPLARP